MIRIKTLSCLGPTIALRFGGGLFARLRDHLEHDRFNEQFAFALCRNAETQEGTTLLVHQLFLPAPQDLSEQSGGGVCPGKPFMRLVYGRAMASGSTILDIHTHPHPGVPSFSGIDKHHAEKNARYIAENFPEPVTHAMLVFGYDVEGHDAVVYDRGLQRFRPIDRVEVLGRPTQIRPTGKPRGRESADPQYARQLLVPGWDQEQLSRLRVAIVGAGGTGAQIFQTLASLGVGTDGWIALIDPDDIEASNLPRIPYAAPRHIGRKKVDVARAYGKVRNPKITIHAIAERIRAADDVPLLRSASVIFGAGDNDGVRRVLNEISVRHLIPYIDLGCDIQVGDEVHAGGQARVVIPGENACLVCCGGFDPSEAALDLLDEAGKAALARHGYVRGADAEATPSVVNLNATTAQLGVTALLGLVQGEVFGAWDYARYDQLRSEVVPASSSRSETCPVCGPDGVLALAEAEPQGDSVEIEAGSSEDERAGSGAEESDVGPDASSQRNAHSLASAEPRSTPAAEPGDAPPDLDQVVPNESGAKATTHALRTPAANPTTAEGEAALTEQRHEAPEENGREAEAAKDASEATEPLWATARSDRHAARPGEDSDHAEAEPQSEPDAASTTEPDAEPAAAGGAETDR